MMKRLAIVAVVVAAALALPLTAGAQTPDFTGKWVMDPDKSDPMGGGRGGGGGMAGAALTITQTATELTIEREGRGGVIKTVYKLDGTESVNAMGGRGGEVKSTSKWDGAKLLTKSTSTRTTQSGESMTIETEEVRSLDADGTMVVVTTTKSQMGEQTRKTVFKKG